MVKKGKMNKKLKVFLIVLSVLVLLAGSAFAGSIMYAKSKLSQIKTVDIPKEPEKLGIDPSKFNDDGITNILLLGVDSRDPKSDPGRSDSMMILTIDKKNNKLKLTSLMRDSLVNIDGYGQQKLTHAHAFGGPVLALKTVNENYQMNITDYVEVNFFGLEKIIDQVGGVQINVAQDEISLINGYMAETSSIEHEKPIEITHAGLQTLNGMQAVAYSRIRYVGNSDFQRTERQRTVLTAVFKKLSSTNIANISGVADSITPYIETSLRPNDMMSFATYILTHKMTNVEQSRVPYDDLYKNGVVDGGDVLIWDKQPTIDRLHQFIFGTNNN